MTPTIFPSTRIASALRQSRCPSEAARLVGCSTTNLRKRCRRDPALWSLYEAALARGRTSRFTATAIAAARAKRLAGVPLADVARELGASVGYASVLVRRVA